MIYQADYEAKKLRAVALAVKSIVDGAAIKEEKTVPMQMINVGIRKLHDNAKSPYGNKKGKYLGHPLWSKDALEHLANNNGSINGITKYLSHEHLIPLKIVVQDFICTLPRSASAETYEQTILKYAAVAIITREEDKKFGIAGLNSAMPSGWDKEDVFARYRKVGLYGFLIEA